VSTVIEVNIINVDGITVTYALADTLADENQLEWTDPFTGETCLFRLRRDIERMWIEAGP
jgi:hypothetical protein